MSLAINIRTLRYRYPGASEDCLDIEAFQARAGERVFLHGPSGSGKSTLLGLMGGVLQAQHGALELLGNDLSRLLRRKEGHIKSQVAQRCAGQILIYRALRAEIIQIKKFQTRVEIAHSGHGKMADDLERIQIKKGGPEGVEKSGAIPLVAVLFQDRVRGNNAA